MHITPGLTPALQPVIRTLVVATNSHWILRTASLLGQTMQTQYRNINLLSIGYAFRPDLRLRLTLGGLTLPRKPWTYGEGDSHPLSRYLFQHKHYCITQRSSQSAFFDTVRSSTA